MTRLYEIQSIYLGNNNPHPTEQNLYFQTSQESVGNISDQVQSSPDQGKYGKNCQNKQLSD